MANILDYVKWRGDLSFKEREINVPDMIILAQFTLYNLDGIVGFDNHVTMKELRDKMYALNRESESVGLLAPMDMKGLLDEVCVSPRFKDIVISHRLDELDMAKDMQITAMTVDIKEAKTRCIIFSGTGDTLVAWKEDFNLMYKVPTPSQSRATKYLEEMAKNFSGKIYVFGHSKGGNLTLYSAVHCNAKTQKKLTKIYSFDGPGYAESDIKNLVSSPIYGKIVSVMPEGSIVGRLFYHKEKVLIVKSENKGLYQHDAFNWQISGSELVLAEKTNEDSDAIANLTRNVIEGMNEDTREEFVEALYKMLYATEAKTLLELSAKGVELLKSFKKLNESERKILLEISGKLFSERTVRKLLAENIFESLKKK